MNPLAVIILSDEGSALQLCIWLKAQHIFNAKFKLVQDLADGDEAQQIVFYGDRFIWFDLSHWFEAQRVKDWPGVISINML